MNIKILPVGPFEANCCIVYQNREAIIIDPGAEADLISNFISKKGLKVVAYIATHGHADHIGATSKLNDQQTAPFAIHQTDEQWAFSETNQIPSSYRVPNRPQTDILDMSSQENWTFGSIDFQCIQTPGHTPGSVCLYFGEYNILVAGDTLFKRSCGRTDLPGGSSRELKNSLCKIKELPRETVVYPGHGPSTTIDEERKYNIFMQ